jgi:hypothetical protein
MGFLILDMVYVLDILIFINLKEYNVIQNYLSLYNIFFPHFKKVIVTTPPTS